jgi:iron(III) transport system ATP-binding protein
MKDILCLKNISINFASQEILKDITLNIQKGKIISLLGQSGSGKSTLLNIIAGFLHSHSGSMYLDNKLIFDHNTFVQAQKRNIGFVFQNYALFPHMNVFDNITFGIDHLDMKKRKEIAHELLELVQLRDYCEKFPHELSGGEQQRVALIRSMALNPSLLLLDEPFSGIDNMVKDDIQKELLTILKKSNKTAIIVTHDVNEAVFMSDKIIYLEGGRIMQYDTPQNIFENPANSNIKKVFEISQLNLRSDLI